MHIIVYSSIVYCIYSLGVYVWFVGYAAHTYILLVCSYTLTCINGHNSDTFLPPSLHSSSTAWVISGPNAGGKTIVLKTAGLLALMVCTCTCIYAVYYYCSDFYCRSPLYLTVTLHFKHLYGMHVSTIIAVYLHSCIYC